MGMFGFLGIDTSQVTDVALRLHNLGVLEKDQGNPERAETLYKRSLVILETYFGLTHPSIVKCLTNLSALYLENGMLDSANEANKRIQDIYRGISANERGLKLSFSDTTKLLEEAVQTYRLISLFNEKIIQLLSHPDVSQIRLF